MERLKFIFEAIMESSRSVIDCFPKNQSSTEPIGDFPNHQKEHSYEHSTFAGKRFEITSFLPSNPYGDTDNPGALNAVLDLSELENHPVELSNVSNNPLCKCGLATEKFRSKVPHSFGREFYRCRNSCQDNSRGCDFFEWSDRQEKTRQLPSTGQVKEPQLELQRRFGHRNFRSGQYECIEAALNGKDVYCLIPTGGGKSVVYQVRDLYLSLIYHKSYNATSFLPGAMWDWQ